MAAISAIWFGSPNHPIFLSRTTWGRMDEHSPFAPQPSIDHFCCKQRPKWPAVEKKQSAISIHGKPGPSAQRCSQGQELKSPFAADESRRTQIEKSDLSAFISRKSAAETASRPNRLSPIGRTAIGVLLVGPRWLCDSLRIPACIWSSCSTISRCLSVRLRYEQRTGRTHRSACFGQQL
jgi:hypothetical protein